MFKNLQWEVTHRGLEARSPYPEYVIPARELFAVRDDEMGPVYEFLADLPKKKWVREEELIEAFLAAATFHSAPIDAATMQRSIGYCRATASLTREPRVPQK